MNGLKQLLTGTRRRKVIAATASTLLVCAAVGFAYYLSAITLSGEGSNTVGKSSATISEALTVAVPANLTPGPGKPLAVSIKPASAIVLNSGATMTQTITNSKEGSGCKNSWFAVEQEGVTGIGPELLSGTHKTTTAYTFPAGVATTLTGMEVVFQEQAGENQSACEGTTLTVKLVLTGSGT